MSSDVILPVSPKLMSTYRKERLINISKKMEIFCFLIPVTDQQTIMEGRYCVQKPCETGRIDSVQDYNM
jgi:hypothetical protein